MSAEGGTKAILAAFAANLGIAVAKFIGFLVTGASSMLAESIHSLADTGNQGLLILGHRRARRGPDEEHPFGYGRERFFYAFIVAMVLFTVGALFAIVEGIEKIEHPEHVESAGVALAVLAAAVLLEGWSLRTAVGEASHAKGDRGWLAFIRAAKSPDLPVVLLEDIAAMIGLVVAFTALLLAWQVDPVYDGIGTLLIGAVLGCVAVLLAVEMKSLLMGESASRDDVDAITAAIESSPRVSRVIHLRTEHLGPDELLVGVKVAFSDDLSVSELAAAIDETEVAIRAAVGSAHFVYIEPDIYRERTESPVANSPIDE